MCHIYNYILLLNLFQYHSLILNKDILIHYVALFHNHNAYLKLFNLNTTYGRFY